MSVGVFARARVGVWAIGMSAAGVFCTLIASAQSPSILSAQSIDDGAAVIVVLKDGGNIRNFEGSYRADDRAVLDPDSWQYLDQAIAGGVQYLERQHGFRSRHVFTSAIKGFSARLTKKQIASLRQDPLVAYIEPDREMAIVAQTLPWGVDRIEADLSSTLAGNGSGDIGNVRAYVIDTGIDTSNSDLRVIGHQNFAGGPNRDCHGHGTHVAGTIAARDNTRDVVGVAPGVQLTGVKVLDCNGSGLTSNVIKGVDWVTAHAVKPAVANMSLGGPASTALDDAIRRSAASGIVYALAAGNSGADACLSSPARAGAGTNNGIITTAAVDDTEREASWSNFGSCVDIWAPGVNILSTRLGGGTTTMSGTSMASPHVAGGAALYLSRNPTTTSANVEASLKSWSFSPGTTSKDARAIIRLWVGAF